jgi:hypothetical protein
LTQNLQYLTQTVDRRRTLKWENILRQNYRVLESEWKDAKYGVVKEEQDRQRE